MDALEALSNQIAACRRCEKVGLQVHHSSKLYRGLGRRRVMVVGVQPGNTEKTSGQAFSGNAGTRLMQWLGAAGLGETREEIFKAVYFTSVIKCATINRNLDACAEQCFAWLDQQLLLVKPRVVVTLGKVPLQLMFETSLSLDDVVGRTFVESELTQRMFPLLPSKTIIIPLPHPSGMSRWPNLPENRARILEAMASLNKVVNG